MTHVEPIMVLQSVAKTFGGTIVALRGVNLTILPGKVHGLLGANGAGKSTLIKILSGTFQPSGGEIIWRGQKVRWDSPKAANDMGVATVHQHIPLALTLPVIENVFLGSRGYWRHSKDTRKRFFELCERIGYWLDPDRPVSSLSIGERQMVSIFQALATGADLIVMDEPTASLAAEERELVYRTVRRLSAGENKAILFVSHFLDEVIALTDQITILRDGEAVLRAETRDMNEESLAEAIVGKQIVKLEREHAERADAETGLPTEILLELRNLSSPARLKSLSCHVAKGEVIGVAGLLGSGRSELLHAIFGADTQATGQVILNGKPVGRSTQAAISAGIGLVPEDRMAQGLVPAFEIWKNITLPALHGVSAFRFMPVPERERQRGADAIRRLAIKAMSPDIAVGDLSGGNAQKVTIAKWLYSDVKLFLLDEPTAGIDVGAKADILRLIRKLATEGKSVIMVSSEFEELMAVADRILVMRDGQCIAERNVRDTSEHDLLLLASGHVAACAPDTL